MIGLQSVLVTNASNSAQQWGSRWMILTKNDRFMSQEFIQLQKQRMPDNMSNVRLWTDDFSSPFQLLK